MKRLFILSICVVAVLHIEGVFAQCNNFIHFEESDKPANAGSFSGIQLDYYPSNLIGKKYRLDHPLLAKDLYFPTIATGGYYRSTVGEADIVYGFLRNYCKLPGTFQLYDSGYHLAPDGKLAGDDFNFLLNLNEDFQGPFRVEVKLRDRRVVGGDRISFLDTKDFCRIADEGTKQGNIYTVQNRKVGGLNETYVVDGSNRTQFKVYYSGEPGYCSQMDEIEYRLVRKDGVPQSGEWSPRNQMNLGQKINIDGVGLYEYEVRVWDYVAMDDGTALPHFYGPWNVVIEAVPSCHNDPKPTISLTSSTGQSRFFQGVSNEAFEGYELEQGKEYVFNFNGTTSFDQNYTVSLDDGGGMLQSFSNGELAVSKLSSGVYRVEPLTDIGSYRLVATKNDDLGKYCQEFEPLRLYVGGYDYFPPSENCTVHLPGDFGSLFGPKVVDEVGEQYILKHFQYTVSSDRNIIIDPGVVLENGAELVLKRFQDPDYAYSEFDLNWTQVDYFDDQGRLVSSGKKYFDEVGNTIQKQLANLSSGSIFAQQGLTNEFGEQVFESLMAPVQLLSKVDDCGDPVVDHAVVPFAYKEDFIVDTEGRSYDWEDFSGPALHQPVPVGDHEFGTLGWYYGSQNNLEPYVGHTAYPYAISNNVVEPIGSITEVVVPGDEYRGDMGYLHHLITESTSLPETDSLWLLYLAMANQQNSGTYIPNKTGVYTQNTIGVDGELVRQITDQNELLLVSSLGSSSKNTAFYFYDKMGKKTLEVTPNGIAQWQLGDPWQDIEKRTFTYDVKGRLRTTYQSSEGTSRLLYTIDGRLRFSQNDEQLEPFRCSYMSYDEFDRVVEIGELVWPEGSFFGEGLEQMTNLSNQELESLGASFSTDITYTYDVSSPSAPIRQRFINGKLSKIENASATKWFSYDERGRVDNMATYYSIFDSVITIEYAYDPNGNVQQLSYGGGQISPFFYAYEYNEDGQITSVRTSSSSMIVNDGSIVGGTLHAVNSYYMHGPLKRTELYGETVLGEEVVLQGLDYTYTLNGDLKGINHPNPVFDPGADGQESLSDVFSLMLDYHDGDYQNSLGHFVPVNESSLAEDHYDGVVKSMAVGVATPDHWGVASRAGSYEYHYDQKDQLIAADWGAVELAGGFSIHDPLIAEAVHVDQIELDLFQSESFIFQQGVVMNPGFAVDASTGGQFFALPGRTRRQKSTTGAYALSDVGYDANGNILGLKRNDRDGDLLDDFDGKYQYAKRDNRLTQVDGYASYTYNAIGQLVNIKSLRPGGFQGMADSVSFTYTPDGMIEGIYNGEVHPDNKFMSYAYDGEGYRIWRTDLRTNTTELYIRDADGVQLATVELVAGGLHGIQKDIVASNTRYGAIDNSGQAKYELRDHVGNVRAVVNRQLTADNEVDLVSFTNYYPFGQVAETAGQRYRYGYQGAYAADETGVLAMKFDSNGDGVISEEDEYKNSGFNVFDMRSYDPVIGRWATVDPYREYWSPYVGNGNSPVSVSDPSGGRNRKGGPPTQDDPPKDNDHDKVKEYVEGDEVYTEPGIVIVLSRPGDSPTSEGPKDAEGYDGEYDHFFNAGEYYLVGVESMNEILKSGVSTRSLLNHVNRINSGNMTVTIGQLRNFSRISRTGVPLVGLVFAYAEADAHGWTPQAETVFAMDFIMTGVGLICPVCGIAYGVARIALEVSGYDIYAERPASRGSGDRARSRNSSHLKRGY